MENFLNWLVMFLKTKIIHLPFIAALHICAKQQEENDSFDLGDLGDNMPYVFLK